MGIVHKGRTQINPGVRNLPQVIKKNLQFHFTDSITSLPKNNTWVNLVDKDFLKFNHEQNPFIYTEPLQQTQGSGGGGPPPIVLYGSRGIIFNGVDRLAVNFNPPGHRITNINNLTVSLWVKQYSSSNLNSGMFWISDGSSRMFFIKYDNTINTLYLATENKNINVKTSIDLNNKWVNLTAIRSPSELKLFVDANLVSNIILDEAYSGLWNIYARYITIGSLLFEGSPINYFNGEIPSVSVYDRALDPEEIRLNYINLKGKYI